MRHHKHEPRRRPFVSLLAARQCWRHHEASRRADLDRAHFHGKIIKRAEEKESRKQIKANVQSYQAFVLRKVDLCAERGADSGCQDQKEEYHKHDATSAGKLGAHRGQLATERTSRQLIAQSIKQEWIEAVTTSYAAHSWAGDAPTSRGTSIIRHGTIVSHISSGTSSSLDFCQIDDALAVLARAGDPLGGGLADQETVARAAYILFAIRSRFDRLKQEEDNTSYSHYNKSLYKHKEHKATHRGLVAIVTLDNMLLSFGGNVNPRSAHIANDLIATGGGSISRRQINDRTPVSTRARTTNNANIIAAA